MSKDNRFYQSKVHFIPQLELEPKDLTMRKQ